MSLSQITVKTYVIVKRFLIYRGKYELQIEKIVSLPLWNKVYLFTIL